MIEPSNAEQATWSDVTRDYVRDLQIEIERLREALETIQTSHVPDQPASRDVDPEKYIHEHHTKLRRIARAALQSKEGNQ